MFNICQTSLGVFRHPVWCVIIERVHRDLVVTLTEDEQVSFRVSLLHQTFLSDFSHLPINVRNDPCGQSEHSPLDSAFLFDSSDCGGSSFLL